MVCHAVVTYHFGDRRLWRIIHLSTLLIALAMGAGSYLYRWCQLGLSEKSKSELRLAHLDFDGNLNYKPNLFSSIF